MGSIGIHACNQLQPAGSRCLWDSKWSRGRSRRDIGNGDSFGGLGEEYHWNPWGLSVHMRESTSASSKLTPCLIQALSGISLLLSGSRNVIIRNLKISTPPTSSEAITLENSRSIWIDHCELGPKSRINVTRGSDYVSITNNLFHDHSEATPAVTVGHSDGNSAQDKGKLHITFGRNYFKNVKSAVSFRFGTGHLFNSYYDTVENGINTRMGAEVLVEASVFASGQLQNSKAVFSADSAETGFATIRDVVLGNSTNTAPAGDMTADSVPYPYDWYIYDTESVKSAVTRYAGQTLEFLD